MKLKDLKNVECMGWVKHMRDAYARTRVLLGPSIWPEPFGRIFVEAASNGIPSIASRRGGIPEAVGKGGLLIDDIFDVNRWVEALRRLEDPDVYTAYEKNARENAANFSSDASLAQFLESTRKVMGIEL
jgi:glycosyltransferase involved in cell wall biosynthesis